MISLKLQPVYSQYTTGTILHIPIPIPRTNTARTLPVAKLHLANRKHAIGVNVNGANLTVCVHAVSLARLYHDIIVDVALTAGIVLRLKRKRRDADAARGISPHTRAFLANLRISLSKVRLRNLI
jgi:hypothetical protein